jgi:hypothetical protein
MDNTNAQEVINSILQIGKERLVKIRITDTAKCSAVLFGKTNGDFGFEVLEVSVSDSYEPQIEALNDVRGVIDIKINEIKERGNYRIIQEKGGLGE